MTNIKNSSGMTLEVHTDDAILYHLTDVQAAKQILKKGLLPSEYGDLDVDNNDGKGVYAIKDLSDLDYVMSLAGWLLGIEDTVVIKFKTTGKWYVCVDEVMDEDDIEDGEDYEDCPEVKPHYGYVVHPDAVPSENIVSAKTLMDVLKEQGVSYP